MTCLAHKKTTFNITCNVLCTSTSLCRRNRWIKGLPLFDLFNSLTFTASLKKSIFKLTQAKRRKTHRTSSSAGSGWLGPASDVKPRLLPPAVSEADSVVKVAEWQQTYYSSDSGIQSGATTVRDDESSTEYSGRKKYTSSSSAASNSAASAGGAAGGGDPALESPTGETLRVGQWDVVSSPPSALRFRCY